MSRAFRGPILFLAAALAMSGSAFAADASITISGAETQVSGTWDTGSVTISFGNSAGHNYSETVNYGQFSSPASIASAFGAKFSNDYVPAGLLCAHAVGPVIYFHLKGTDKFGIPSISYPSTSFSAAKATWQATPTITWVPAAIAYGAGLGTTLDIQAGVINTLAGNGTAGYTGDSGGATSAELNYPAGVAVDGSGNIYILDQSNGVVRKVAASTGIISTLAGPKGIDYAWGLAVDSSSNVYIANVCSISKVTASTGQISTVVGDYNISESTLGCGFSGDGGAATNALLFDSSGVAVDSLGNIYIADSGNYRIRKVTASTGIITTVAGNGAGGYPSDTGGYSGDGGAAVNAELNYPSGVAVDSFDNIYIADSRNNVIRKVAVSTGIITTVAGNGTGGYSGDGGAATSAELNDPWSVAVDLSGNIYIGDMNNSVIRKVTASTGIISTVAGSSAVGYSGDGGLATGAELFYPMGVAVNPSGNSFFVADSGNARLRAVGLPNLVLGPAQLNATANVPGTFVYTPSAGYTSAFGSQIILSTVFTPSDTTDYTAATASVPLTVNLGTPTLSFSAIPAQTYGAGPFSVSASSPSTGAITYGVVSGPATISGSTVTITGPGTVVLKASQTATAYYTAANTSISFAVTSAAPVLSFSNIPDITYGIAPFAVSASSVSSGVITYSVVSGPATISGSTVTITGTGTVVLSAFQASTAYFASANASVTFTVNKATPLITWATPAPITSGSTLSGTQLNASSQVPGSFSYSPALGTTLTTGPQALIAIFTPNNSAYYNTSSATVYLTVVQSGTKSDSGTITLTVGGIVASSTNYSAGASPSSIAAGLANGLSSNSKVSIVAVDNTLYVDGKPSYAGTDFSYSLATTSWDSLDFSQPSFQGSPSSGTLEGGASTNSAQQQVYGYTANYDGVSNVIGYADSVMGTWSFSNGYDTLNRLIAGAATSGPYAGQNLCWSYDSFGNRTAQSNQTTACPSSPSTLPATASYSGNNHVTWTSVNAAGSNIAYDAAGNITNDGVNTYLYDIEGRICAVRSEPVAGTYTMTGYLYDAEGRRISKGSIANMNSCDPAVNGFQPSTEHDYILGLSGEQVTETAMDSNNSMAWQHTNVWVGSKPLATYDSDGLHFYLNDQLGTRRVQTDYAGVPEQTCSSLPFGDSLSCTSSALYPTEHNYVGKERDTESGNDYFGARYYSSGFGRWLSPDLPLADQDPADPQSWNLYRYAGNNPVNSVDNDGLLTIIVPGTWWESSGGWGPDNALFGYANSALRGSCTQDCTQFLDWKPSGNNDKDRIAAAQRLRQMIAAHKFAPGEKLNIISHSHGGNVALAASHLGLAHRIDTLITLNKPTLDGEAYKPGNNIGNFFNISVSADSTQMYGSNAWHFATDHNATNVTLPTMGYDNPHAALIWNVTHRDLWTSWLQSHYPNDTPAPKDITIYVYPNGTQSCDGCAGRVQ